RGPRLTGRQLHEDPLGLLGGPVHQEVRDGHLGGSLDHQWGLGVGHGLAPSTGRGVLCTAYPRRALKKRAQGQEPVTSLAGALLHRSCQSTAPLSSSESLRPRGIRQNSTSQPATEAATADRYTHPGAVVQKISSSTVKIGPPRAISHASVGNGSVAPIGGGSGGVYPSSSSSGMS